MTTPRAAGHAVHDLNVWLRDPSEIKDARSELPKPLSEIWPVH